MKSKQKTEGESGMLTKKKLTNSRIELLSNAAPVAFPKYATQIINLLNSNAQGTRPKVVGQMSDLIQEFDGNTLEEWVQWYNERNPDAIEQATDRIYAMHQQMSEAFNAITRKMIEDWVKDLVYTKTYCGLKFQSAILASLAEERHLSWRLATKEEEAQGIDGFVGEQPLQIKPTTYRMEAQLQEHIDVPIVFYQKKKDGIVIEFDNTLL